MDKEKQNLTIVANDEEAYERAARQALTLLKQGFHLGGAIRISRDELHGLSRS
jgi:hypothetical protein